MSITRSQWLGGLLALTLVLAYLAPPPPAEDLGAVVRSASPGRIVDEVTAGEPEPVLLIRARDGTDGMSRSLVFDTPASPETLAAPAPPTLMAVAQQVAVAATPVPPPTHTPALPVVFGRYDDDGRTALFISHAGRNWVVHEGDRIDDQYEVKRIDAGSAILFYLPQNEHQTITFAQP